MRLDQIRLEGYRNGVQHVAVEQKIPRFRHETILTGRSGFERRRAARRSHNCRPTEPVNSRS